MSSAKRLAREILDTRRLALGHATSPQLTSSALDGGQLDITDGDGNRVGGLGLGDDGGFVIDYTGGPKPPKPSPPTVTADAGIFRIEWDGSFVNEGDEGILATSDTDRVEIHASMDENFVPDRVESFGGAFATLDGGSFTLGPLPEAGTYYFRLVARSKSAQFSEPSERVEQELAITSIDLEITDAWLTGEAAQNTADGKNSIWRGPDEPEADPGRPFKDGDIWFEMVDGKSIPNIWDETAGAWVANDDYRQSEIERVQQELRDELDTIIVDGSGTKNFYTPDMPTEGMSEGDLWFDSSDKNKPYIYQDGEWITVRDSFAPPGAGQNVFALLDAAGSTPNAIDNQWSNVDGFTLTPGPLGSEAEVPTGAATGTATIRLPLAGTFNAAGEWQLSADEVIDPNGLGLGVSGTVEFYSPGATPTAKVALRVLVPDTGMIDVEQPLTVVDDVFGNSQTHSVDFDSEQLLILGLYPTVYAWSLYLEVSVDSVPGNMVETGINIAYAVGNQGIAPGAVTETKISDDSISTPKLQSKVITTDKIATGAITAESGIIGSINAGTITVGEMDGARVKARSIYSDKLLIGDPSSLIAGVEPPDASPHYAEGGSSLVLNDALQRDGVDPGYCLHFRRSTESGEVVLGVLHSTRSDSKVLVTPNEVYGLEALVEASGSYKGGKPAVRWGVREFNKEGSLLRTILQPSEQAVTINYVWAPLAWRYTASPDAVAAEVVVLASDVEGDAHTYIDIASPTMVRASGATLIKDGAISTEHIRTGAITAESGIIGSIDANVITVGKIMGNQLDADAINGKTITGATIRTASSGSRVELTHNGLKQYNSLGATIVDMTAGSFTLQGGSITGSTIKTATSGSRVEITTQGLKQFNSSNEVIAEMVGGSMVMRGVLEQTNSIGRLQVGPTFGSGNVSPGISWSNIPGDAYGAGIGVATGTNTVALVMQGPGGGSAASRINLFKERAYIASYATGNSYLNMADKSFTLRAQDSSGDAVGFISANDDKMMVSAYTRNLELWGRRVQSMSIYNTTGVTSASVYVNASTGSLGRNTSSARYKQDIEAAEPLERLLDVETRYWRDRNSVAQYAEAQAYLKEIGEGPLPCSLSETPDEPGFEFGAIAEEVDGLGLTDLVIYDAFGRPDALHYEKFGIALIPIVRSLRDRIEALEAQLASA